MSTRVRFLKDFRSRDTGEQFFERGQEWQASDEQAAGLLAEGAAELVATELLPPLGIVPTAPVSAPVMSGATGAAPVVKKAARKATKKKASE